MLRYHLRATFFIWAGAEDCGQRIAGLHDEIVAASAAGAGRLRASGARGDAGRG